jgi:hypothetical protein
MFKIRLFMEKTITPCSKNEKKGRKSGGAKKETLQRLLNYSKSAKAVAIGGERWLIHLN